MKSRVYGGSDLEIHALMREGRDPTVVLLHGAAANALAWRPVFPALDGRRIIALDLPGHGESPPVDDWSLERVADRIAGVIGEAHPGRLVWGGHSWGGKIAAILGARHPDRAEGLLLIDPSPASPVPIRAEEFVREAFDGELGPWRSVDEAIASVRTLPQYTRWDEDVEQAFRRGLTETPDGQVAARVRRDWLLEITEAALLHDDSRTIASIQCPTLLVVAERSLYWQESTNLKTLPEAEQVVLPGHHWLHWDNPAALNAAVGPWLSQLGGP